MSRDRVAAEARTQFSEAAHYIKVGCGHKFNAQGQLADEVLRPNLVQSLWGGRRARVPGVPSFVRFAATSEYHGRRVCAGRCGLVLQHSPLAGDPNNERDLVAPTQHVWRRPENFAEYNPRMRYTNPDHTVLGECCIDKRHFDCLGFVIWCFWKVMGTPNGPVGFPFLSGHFVRQPLLDRRREPPRPGDILFSRTSEEGTSTEYTHIGIAVSATEVAHAAGYKWGVQITPIERSGERGGNIVWEPMYGRPTCFGDR
jgi:cell wall-associated NlpC family hydrolase